MEAVRFQPEVAPEIITPGKFSTEDLRALNDQGRLPRLAGGSGSTPGWVAQTTVAKYQAAKTILHLLGAGSEGPQFIVTEFGISCAGTTGTLTLEQYTANGKSQEGTTVTPARNRGATNGPKVGVTAKEKLSAEPEATVLIKKWIFQLPMQPFILPAALGRESGSLTAASAVAGIAVGWKITISTEAEATMYAEFEE